MSRAAQFGSPRATSANRGAEVFPNLLLTTLAVVASFPVGASADMGRPRALTTHRDDCCSRPLAIRANARIAVVETIDFGRPRPLLTQRERDEAPPNLLLARGAAPPPIVGTADGVRPAALPARRAEPIGLNLPLFTVPVVTAPAVGVETAGRPGRLAASRGDPQGVSLQLFVQPAATAPVLWLDTTRPLSLRPVRDDLLGSPFGLIAAGARPFLPGDAGRPLALAPQRADLLGTPAGLFAQPTAPVTNGDLGRPRGLPRGAEAGGSATFQLAFPPAWVPLPAFDPGRPVALRTARDDLSQPFRSAPPLAPVGQASDSARPRSIQRSAADAPLGQPIVLAGLKVVVVTTVVPPYRTITVSWSGRTFAAGHQQRTTNVAASDRTIEGEE